MRSVAALAGMLAALLAAVALASAVPLLTGRVVDNAELLTSATRQALSQRLAAHEAKRGEQVVVLTVRSLDGASIESYADDVFAAWKLGQKGRDNGVLMVVVPGERKLRIEVGYGLEGTLTDVQASRIIRNVITPAFRTGNFDRGLTDGVDAVLRVLDGDASASGGAAATTASAGQGATRLHASGGLALPELQLPPWPLRLLLGAFIFGIIGTFTVVAMVTPGVGWFLYLFLIPFWAMFPMIVVGRHGGVALLGLYLVGFPVTKLLMSRQPWYLRARAQLKATGHATIGGIAIGGSGGGSSGGGGGGFSGGGGSSGGGGASGSW